MTIWDYKAHGGVYSGVNDDQVRSLIQQGAITRDTEIAKAGTERWQAVRVTDFRDDCDQAENASYRAGRKAPLSVPAMPDVRDVRIGFALGILIVSTIIGLALAWHEASSYDPERNGTYNLAEAAILNAGWTQVVAQFISALLVFIVFSTLAITYRLGLIAKINRAGHLATVEEMKAIRSLLAQTAKPSQE